MKKIISKIYIVIILLSINVFANVDIKYIPIFNDGVVVIVTIEDVLNLPVKKTGQIKSYPRGIETAPNSSFRDDGYYKKGLAHSYTRDNTKNVVLDHVTGLMWQDDYRASSIKKPWVTPANAYIFNYGDTSGDTAASYCSNLSLGGYTDWRLPSRKELISILYHEKMEQTIHAKFRHVTEEYASPYWTSTERVSMDEHTSNAWAISFGEGIVLLKSRSRELHVRCVRTRKVKK